MTFLHEEVIEGSNREDLGVPVVENIATGDECGFPGGKAFHASPIHVISEFKSYSNLGRSCVPQYYTCDSIVVCISINMSSLQPLLT